MTATSTIDAWEKVCLLLNQINMINLTFAYAE